MKTRNLAFDNLKGLAIILVVFIHVNSRAYPNSPLITNDYIDIILRQLSNLAVPLFLFISGYFIATKEITTKEEYFSYLKKQIPRVLAPFIIWTIVYSIYQFAKGDEITRIIKNAIKFQAAVPFYFILLICQYYILQPLIIWLSKNIYKTLLSIVISLISAYMIHLLRNDYKIDLPIFIYAGAFTTWLAFPVLGAYVRTNKPRLNNLVLAFFTAIFLALSIYISIDDYSIYNDIQNHISAVKASSFMYSVTAILLLYQIFNAKINGQNILTNLGIYSFGIYFSHMLFLDLTNKILAKFMNTNNYDQAVVQFIITILILLITYILGFILRKINPHIASKYFGY